MAEGSGSQGGSVLTRLLVAPVEYVGRATLGVLDHVGDVLGVMWQAISVILASLVRRRVRLGRKAIVSQMIRVGVRSIGIVSLVSGSVGLILALQLAPPLDEFGRRDLVANIIGVAVLRELGPLIGAIVLTGFAGASIAAEIGTMVVSEEIEALEAHALNPVRFLVVPRLIATVLSMTALAIFADVVAIGAALWISTAVLGIPQATFWENLLVQVKLVDFLTGVVKGGVFGTLIGMIACVNGLRVVGGAAGVGSATTRTVVQSVVAIIIADLFFTAVFYATGLV
ncbi:MAG: ABC transporter permease [Phycisphaeraceae bacterium]|nr:ABC transporter permease [Phycisphaeraceae bacterium]